MMWVTWRQLRTQATAVGVAVAAAAVLLATTGRRLVALARINRNVVDQLTATDRNLYTAGIVVLALAPAILGAFWGAPLVARELEAGTHRLVWNQSVTRTRWLATKLGLTTAAAAAAVGVLTFAVTWWAHPLDGSLSDTQGGLPQRMTPVAFAMRGIAPVGYAVFAIVLGAALGILLRRPVTAMAVTLVVFAGVQIAVPLWVRPHLAAPVVQTATYSRALSHGIGIRGDSRGKPVALTVNAGRPGDWVLSNRMVDAGGKAAALPAWFGACVPAPSEPVPVVPGQDPRKTLNDCLVRLTREGYHQRIVSQPAGRFWAFQLRETALFLALSGLLAWFCFWWTRRRLAWAGDGARRHQRTPGSPLDAPWIRLDAIAGHYFREVAAFRRRTAAISRKLLLPGSGPLLPGSCDLRRPSPH